MIRSMHTVSTGEKRKGDETNMSLCPQDNMKVETHAICACLILPRTVRLRGQKKNNRHPCQSTVANSPPAISPAYALLRSEQNDTGKPEHKYGNCQPYTQGSGHWHKNSFVRQVLLVYYMLLGSNTNFSPAPTRGDNGQCTYQVTLPPQSQIAIHNSHGHHHG